MDNYLLRFIPFIVFGFFLHKAIRRKNKVAISIISLYFISSFSSLLIFSENLKFHDFSTDSLFSFIVYTIIHSIFLSLTFLVKPFRSIKDLPNGRLYNLIQLIFISGIVFSFIYLTPYAIKSLLLSALELRSDMQIQGLKVLPVSIFTTIAVGFPSFYYVYCLLLFNAIVKKQKLIAFLSLLGPITFIINVLTVSGRDGVLFVFFSFIITYFLFENLISVRQKKRLKNFFILGFILALIPIFYITIDRFSKSGKFDFNTLNRGLINYLGMQPFVFSDYLNDPKTYYNYGANSFPLVISSEVVKTKTFYSGQFGSFLTSFYRISGYSSLFLVSLIFYLLFFLLLKNNRRYSILSMIFILGLFFHFMISGIFYFRLGNRGGNLFMVLSFLMFFLLRNTRKHLNR